MNLLIAAQRAFRHALFGARRIRKKAIEIFTNTTPNMTQMEW